MVSLSRLILVGIVIAITGIDCVWQWIGHFDVDVAAYLAPVGLVLALMLGGIFYEYYRKDRGLSGMLIGLGFLMAFSASFSMLNYFLLTVAHTRIDDMLAAIDRSIGVDWPALMEFAADHPTLNFVLWVAYLFSLWQAAFLFACLGWRTRSDEIESFCLALASGAVLTVFIWTLFPSFGAFSVYDLPAHTANRLKLVLDPNYAHALVKLLADGPGRIAPYEVKGLIGFPSFHTVLAVLVMWYSRSWKALCVPLTIFNLVVLVATPIQGGHHVVDVIAGIAVAVLAIAFERQIAGLSARSAVRLSAHAETKSA